jgi:flagellar assembly factor FliW
VFDPFEIIEGYDPIVENSDLRFLGCKDASDLRFFVIAVVPDDITKITVNLKSPIVVNKQDRRARQVILANSDYPIRFPIFPAEEKQEQ